MAKIGKEEDESMVKQIITHKNAIIGLIIIISICIGSYLFNDKLNRLYHLLSNEINNLKEDITQSEKLSNEINNLKEDITQSENDNIEHTSMYLKTIEYDFGDSFSLIDAVSYNPTGKYYSQEGISSVDVPKDENGVRLLFRKELDDYSYHPVAIAQYGISEFGNWVETGDDGYFESAVAQADYFIDNLDKQTGIAYYDFDFAVGGTKETLKTPWGSAMAQGQICSLLARVYHVTKEEKYYDACKLAIKSLFIDVKDGGVD